MGRWNPQYVIRAVEPVLSSTNVVIVETDIGQGYLKAIGNPSGEHCLACEFVGTQLAEWLGLQTLDYGLITLDVEFNVIRFHSGGCAKSGPAFITRLEKGQPWQGTRDELRKIMNPEDISRLVVLDTWIMNRDRKSPLMAVTDNILLSQENAAPGKVRLVAIDHTHCLGASGRDQPSLARLENVDDRTIYGLFPEFRDSLDRAAVRDAARRLKTLTQPTVESIVESIPLEWKVSQSARKRLARVILNRAAWVAENIEHSLLGPKHRQGRFDFGVSENQP